MEGYRIILQSISFIGVETISLRGCLNIGSALDLSLTITSYTQVINLRARSFTILIPKADGYGRWAS